MLTGVPRKERWWLWAFFIWIFLSLGPGLLMASKPVFIGYFPLLYVWSLAFFAVSLVLTYILGYKLTFTNVPEDVGDEDDTERRKA